MTRYNLTLIVLLLLLAATGGCAWRGAQPADPSTPRFAAELEPYEEAVSPACAYYHFAWGKSAELDGSLEEARYAYEQALLCDREADYVMRSLAMLLLRQGKRAEALIWVQRMVELRPEDTASRGLLANLYSAAGEPERAAAIYRDILAEDPGNPNITLLLAALYVEGERLGVARELLEELTVNQPGFMMGHYYLARLYRDFGEMDAALASYERALAVSWSPALARELAGAYELAGRYEESLRLYQQMVAEDPTDERARGLLANLYLRMNRVDDALAELAELRHYITDVGNVDLTIARILVDEGRLEEAVALLRSLLSEEPRLDAVRSLLVLAYYRMERIGEARALLEEIRPGDAGYEEAVLMLARIYHGQDDPAGAMAVLTRALADPDHRYLSFYVTLALLHAEWQDAGQGMLVFDRALRELGRTVKVLFEYALYLEKIGHSDAALAKMQEVLTLDPHDPFALNYVGYTWADRNENLEKAREYIEEAIRIKPEDGAIRDSLGWVYFRLGDYRRAVEELEQAAQILPDDPVIHDHLGDAYRKLGRITEAAAAYDRALELLDPEEDRERWLVIEEKRKELAR
ncbi:tetratricopeptide repeat protein [Desulfurivibrio sp. D14AmB]|uniref:tetratricopeptide repeat protein n=1 Tax=Desulfurivibrio sp. D14AmB TaxID=3374370 RepID=UPI00376EC686